MADKHVEDWNGPLQSKDAAYGKVYTHSDDSVEYVEFSSTGAELLRKPGRPKSPPPAPAPAPHPAPSPAPTPPKPAPAPAPAPNPVHPPK